MRTLFTVLGAWVLALSATAQQEAQFSQQTQVPELINPAAAGREQATCAAVILRHQWAGFEGNPCTGAFSLHRPVVNVHGAVGLSAMADRLGQERNINVRGVYAYRMRLPNRAMLSLGVGVSWLSKTLDNNWRLTGNEPVENDPAINNVSVTSGAVALDAGAFYQSERLFFGLSVAHLDASRLRESDGLPAPFALRYDLVRHYHVQAGYRWTLPTDPDFEVRPTLLVQTDLTTAQVTVTTRVVYQERLWGGVGYRHEDALILLAGVRVAAMGPGYLRAGYAYDLTISGLSRHSSGSHELLVTYCWPFTVHRESYTPVRWLGNSAGVPSYRKP